MTQELQDILSGKRTLEMQVVDYSTPEKKEELKKLWEKSKNILKRKEVDWQELNSFVIKR
jgi:hypothetical protein